MSTAVPPGPEIQEHNNEGAQRDNPQAVTESCAKPFDRPPKRSAKEVFEFDRPKLPQLLESNESSTEYRPRPPKLPRTLLPNAPSTEYCRRPGSPSSSGNTPSLVSQHPGQIIEGYQRVITHWPKTSEPQLKTVELHVPSSLLRKNKFLEDKCGQQRRELDDLRQRTKALEWQKAVVMALLRGITNITEEVAVNFKTLLTDAEKCRSQFFEGYSDLEQKAGGDPQHEEFVHEVRKIIGSHN